jgi:hypothetical protein
LTDTGHESERQQPSPQHVAVRALLRSDAVCEDIAVYLHHHRSALDTARGVAEWWVDRDPRSTENALSKLLEHRVVTSYAHGSVRIYGYTKDRDIRRTVAAHVKSAQRSAPRIDAQRIG